MHLEWDGTLSTWLSQLVGRYGREQVGNGSRKQYDLGFVGFGDGYKPALAISSAETFTRRSGYVSRGASEGDSIIICGNNIGKAAGEPGWMTTTCYLLPATC